MEGRVEWSGWLTDPVVYVKVEFPITVPVSDPDTWCETMYYRLRRRFNAHGITSSMDISRVGDVDNDDGLREESRIGKIWLEWKRPVGSDEINRALRDLEEIVRGDGPRLIVPPELAGDSDASE